MARGNDYWPKDELIAAALLQIPFTWADGTTGPIMDHEMAKKLSAKDIISLFDKDHDPHLKVDGGPNVAWNCTWRPKSLHRIKTATVDVPRLRKGERLSRAQEEFRARMLARAGQGPGDGPGVSERPKFKRKWPSRPMRSHQRRVKA